GAVRVYTSDSNSQLSGAISGSGGFALDGSGTLRLTGPLSYTGTTNVNGGTLLLNSTLAGVPVVVADGATFGGFGTIQGALTVESGGTVAPGNSPGIITVNGTVTFQATDPGDPPRLVMEVNGTTPGTQFSVTSGPSLFKGATFTVIDNVDASTQVVGTFLDLPEAAIFNAGSVFY